MAHSRCTFEKSVPRTLPLLLLMTHCTRGPAASATANEPATAAVAAQPTVESSVCHPVDFPDSVAGRRLEELVAAMNTSDPRAAELFVATALKAQPRERYGDFIVANAGDELVLALCRVEFDAANDVVALVGGANDRGGVDYGAVVLSVDDGGTVASLGVMPVAKEDLMQPAESLDDADVSKIVEGIADGLADYVLADKAAAMSQRIRAARDAGEYAGITNGHLLAHRLMDDLIAVSHDKHLDVTYRAAAPEPARAPTQEELERLDEMAAQDRFGMPVAEIRDGSIGYVVVLGFLPPQVAAEAVAEVMSKVADADALIIDLRDNGGGSPHGVALMTSYLFGNKRVHLNDIYNRSTNSTESFHTSPDVPGRKFGPTKPVYVLTSARTFSAGEEFAYNLKARKRATIVGETTGGGAHPIEFVRISDHWTIALPTARAINPVTGANWEGTGVTPDVEVPAGEALDKALELARGRRPSEVGPPV